jgi:hypothetical protein
MMDFTKIKKLTIGGVELKQLLVGGIQVWKSGYKNWVKYSTEADGVTVYNGGLGYKSGIRLSTSDGGDRTKEGMYVSGYIPITNTDTLRLVNVGTAVVSYEKSRLIFFTSLGSVNDNIDLTTLTPETDGSIVITGDKWFPYDQYVRLSCSYIGEDSAVYKE